jgi:MinD-like ATPase involved in chromosome partitioning or flagellar assembly
MASVDPQIPNWPIAEAVVHADGSATLTIGGKQQPVTAGDPATARGELVRLVRDQLAAELGRPVRLHTVDPDGSEGQLAVAPDGSVTELSVRTRPRHAPSGTAPPSAATPGPRQLRVAADGAVAPEAPPHREGVVVDEDVGGPSAPRQLRRGEVHHREPSALQRAWRWLTDELLVSAGEKAERAEDARLSGLTGASRQNLIVLVGPRGGAGKTMGARTIGGILAAARLGTVLHMDADQDYGPAADLVPDMQRSEKTIIDLLADFDEPPPPPQLRPYTSRFDDGLLVLAAPKKRTDMKKLADELEHYERALELLRGVDVVLMDCAGGIGKVQEWALARADQAIVMCPPDYVAANNIAKVLSDEDLRLPSRTTLVLNDTRPEGGGDLAAIERHFARHSFEERIRIPYDHRMRLMLDQATYRLAALPRDTRLPLKRLAATVGEGLR